jgi:hypothetical protein
MVRRLSSFDRAAISSAVRPILFAVLYGLAFRGAAQPVIAAPINTTDEISVVSNSDNSSGNLVPIQDSATAQTASALLPADRNASANWQKAGLLSVGGIPNRTLVCGGATIKPQGSGKDDTSNIQTAIEDCSPGGVVELAGRHLHYLRGKLCAG